MLKYTIPVYLFQEEFKQLIVLIKHFFFRLFKNDVVDFEDQMMERLIGILVLLGVFSGLLAYGFLSHYGWEPDTGRSWIEKCAMITFFMLIMGFIAVMEWDVIFLDSRDYSNLFPLPIRTRTILIAKFASLCLFVGMFALSMNSLSTIFFVLYLPHWHSSNLLYILSFAFIHISSMFLAVFFTFFFNVSLLGVLMTLFGYRLFTRISTYIRSFLMLAYVFLIVLYLRILIYGLENIFPVEKIKGKISSLQSFNNFFPPLWFTDLYETLLGNTNLPFHGTLKKALIGLVIMLAVFCLTTGLGYKRYLKKVGSVRRKNVHLKRLKRIVVKVFDFTFLRNPIQRAVFHFYYKTLKASIFHKMRLASYIAVGVGLILIIAVPKLKNPTTLLEINKTTLSIPLILSFFLLLGIRGIVNVPISLGANWIFQITEMRNIRHYFTGLRKSIFFLNLFPLFAMLFVLYSFFWDGNTAFYHCLYGLIMSILLMEIFLITYNKIPYACSYLPGKEKIQFFWIVYLFSFLAYINLMIWIESMLLQKPSSLIAFSGTITFIIIGIRIYQVFFFYKKNAIKYEEEPEPVMIGLDYKTPSHRRRATKGK